MNFVFWDYLIAASAAILTCLAFNATRLAYTNKRYFVPFGFVTAALTIETLTAFGNYVPVEVRFIRDLACGWVLLHLMDKRKK